MSSYNLNDRENSVLCKGLNFAILPKAIEYSELLLPFEMFFREITNLDSAYSDKNLTEIFRERTLKH